MQTRKGLPQSLPDTLEVDVYQTCWADLAHMNDQTLRDHYQQYGEDEGRQANRLASRADFVGLIPKDAEALEIGPFCNPILRGEHARFFDVLDAAGLRARAAQLGHEPARVPEIHYVSPVGDLSIVNRTFDCLLSSHCIEHQPDLIDHLQQVARLLRQDGRYFVLVPDKRYCFDHFIAPSTIADLLDAHHSKRKVHDLKSVIEHRALTTHNDQVRHWGGDHGNPFEAQTARVAASLREYEAANGGYIDVHAWYFTPRSAEAIFVALHDLGYLDLDVERLYPTRRASNEFWIVLRKT